jgi:HB1, ASXL, restriction endonuclease HTH domain/Asx homology domain
VQWSNRKKKKKMNEKDQEREKQVDVDVAERNDRVESQIGFFGGAEKEPAQDDSVEQVQKECVSDDAAVDDVAQQQVAVVADHETSSIESAIVEVADDVVQGELLRIFVSGGRMSPPAAQKNLPVAQKVAEKAAPLLTPREVTARRSLKPGSTMAYLMIVLDADAGPHSVEQLDALVSAIGWMPTNPKRRRSSLIDAIRRLKQKVLNLRSDRTADGLKVWLSDESDDAGAKDADANDDDDDDDEQKVSRRVSSADFDVLGMVPDVGEMTLPSAIDVIKLAFDRVPKDMRAPLLYALIDESIAHGEVTGKQGADRCMGAWAAHKKIEERRRRRERDQRARERKAQEVKRRHQRRREVEEREQQRNDDEEERQKEDGGEQALTEQHEREASAARRQRRRAPDVAGEVDDQQATSQLKKRQRVAVAVASAENATQASNDDQKKSKTKKRKSDREKKKKTKKKRSSHRRSSQYSEEVLSGSLAVYPGSRKTSRREQMEMVTHADSLLTTVNMADVLNFSTFCQCLSDKERDELAALLPAVDRGSLEDVRNLLSFEPAFQSALLQYQTRLAQGAYDESRRFSFLGSSTRGPNAAAARAMRAQRRLSSGDDDLSTTSSTSTSTPALPPLPPSSNEWKRRFFESHYGASAGFPSEQAALESALQEKRLFSFAKAREDDLLASVNGELFVKDSEAHKRALGESARKRSATHSLSGYESGDESSDDDDDDYVEQPRRRSRRAQSRSGGRKRQRHSKPMSFIAAAEILLCESRRPMCAKEMVKIALRRGLIETRGLTPENSMSAQIYVRSKKNDSLFYVSGGGTFGLKKLRDNGTYDGDNADDDDDEAEEEDDDDDDSLRPRAAKPVKTSVASEPMEAKRLLQQRRRQELEHRQQQQQPMQQPMQAMQQQPMQAMQQQPAPPQQLHHPHEYRRSADADYAPRRPRMGDAFQ